MKGRWTYLYRAADRDGQTLDFMLSERRDLAAARRFTLNRWAANEQFETLVASILRNTPLRQPSVLTPKSLRRMLQITEGITANIFHMINSLAIDAIENGSEHITNEMVEDWEPEFDAEAAFA